MQLRSALSGRGFCCVCCWAAGSLELAPKAFELLHVDLAAASRLARIGSAAPSSRLRAGQVFPGLRSGGAMGAPADRKELVGRTVAHSGGHDHPAGEYQKNDAAGRAETGPPDEKRRRGSDNKPDESVRCSFVENHGGLQVK